MKTEQSDERKTHPLPQGGTDLITIEGLGDALARFGRQGHGGFTGVPIERQWQTQRASQQIDLFQVAGTPDADEQVQFEFEVFKDTKPAIH